MKIIQQPFAGRTDVDTVIKGGEQTIVRVVDDPACSVQAGKEARRPSAAPHHGALISGQQSRALGQLVRAKEVASDRTGEKILSIVLRTPREKSGYQPRPFWELRRAPRALSGRSSDRHTAQDSRRPKR
jgi:hypothetical protein